MGMGGFSFTRVWVIVYPWQGSRFLPLHICMHACKYQMSQTKPVGEHCPGCNLLCATKIYLHCIYSTQFPAFDTYCEMIVYQCHVEQQKLHIVTLEHLIELCAKTWIAMLFLFYLAGSLPNLKGNVDLSDLCLHHNYSQIQWIDSFLALIFKVYG